MRTHQNMVRAFHEQAGATINEKPTEPSVPDRYLRMALIREESNELFFAMGLRKMDDYDPVKVADAIGDLLYVVLGTAVCCGIDIEPIFEEIHRSNMSKFIDGFKRHDGKWMKGPSYSPANLKPILDAQSGFDKHP